MKAHHSILSALRLASILMPLGLSAAELNVTRIDELTGFTVTTVDPRLAIDADRDLLSSAVGNLLQDAFKFITSTQTCLHHRLAAPRAARAVLISLRVFPPAMGKGAMQLAIMSLPWKRVTKFARS